MKDPLLLDLRKFLEPKLHRLHPRQPLLIGYSGGPDSKALLYLLLECRRFFPLELHIAHIDHGWREESAAEAQEIQSEAERLGLPLHLKSLFLKDFSPGNSEEQGRDHRFRFFAKVYSEIGAQALLLGHHADDQAETILKRIFEGASVFSLNGLGPVSTLKQMQIWRPFLSAQKKQLLQWLSQKKLSYFRDLTNESSQFLRGKMRQEMVPFLSASFGKQIGENLSRLSDESKEIKEYFLNLNKPILEKIEKRGQVDLLNLNPFLPLSILQLKYLIKEWLNREKRTLSRQIIDQIALALCESGSKKKFIAKGCEFLVDKGHLFFKLNSSLVLQSLQKSMNSG
jgi:tRNA(Ile)-lysidine synthase